MWAQIVHILDRAQLHFAWCFVICLAGTLALNYLVRLATKKTDDWARFLPGTAEGQMLLVAVTICWVTALREPYDVYKGQSVVKAFTDFTSWAVPAGLATWANYRLRKLT